MQRKRGHNAGEAGPGWSAQEEKDLSDIIDDIVLASGAAFGKAWIQAACKTGDTPSIEGFSLGANEQLKPAIPVIHCLVRAACFLVLVLASPSGEG